MDFKKLTVEVMTALAESPIITQVDGSDVAPVFESDTKATFNMTKYHDVKAGPDGSGIKPLGIWEVKVTLEVTYKKYDEE